MALRLLHRRVGVADAEFARETGVGLTARFVSAEGKKIVEKLKAGCLKVDGCVSADGVRIDNQKMEEEAGGDALFFRQMFMAVKCQSCTMFVKKKLIFICIYLLAMYVCCIFTKQKMMCNLISNVMIIFISLLSFFYVPANKLNYLKNKLLKSVVVFVMIT